MSGTYGLFAWLVRIESETGGQALRERRRIDGQLADSSGRRLDLDEVRPGRVTRRPRAAKQESSTRRSDPAEGRVWQLLVAGSAVSYRVELRACRPAAAGPGDEEGARDKWVDRRTGGDVILQRRCRRPRLFLKRHRSRLRPRGIRAAQGQRD
jgi:hypothetical protein